MAAKRATSRRSAGGDLRVTWVHSEIGHNAAARGTIRALGLHRLHQTVQIPDTAVNRGMIRRVAFLLDVEEPGTDGPAVTPAVTPATEEDNA